MKIKAFYRIHPKDWWLTSNPDVNYAQRKALKNPEEDETAIEEYVRQWVLRELVETYGYPKEWLGERIVVEEIVQVATTEKQADISIKNELHKTYLYIETKASGITHKEFLKAERQLQTYLSATHTATIGMITDGTPPRTKVLNKKIDPNYFDYLPDIPSYSKGRLRQKTKLVLEIPKDATSGRKTGLQSISETYESILFECHSAIRDIDGLHDDECLDELCKVLYTKIYDERITSQAKVGTPFRFQTYGGNIEEVASNIRDLFEEARQRDIELYSQRIPQYERSRGVFNRQFRLSTSALVRVVELLQNYSLIDSSTDIKGRAFQKVLGSAIRAGMGQYFTPGPIVRLAVGIMDPSPTDLILDPFCGSGHFLTVSLDYVGRKYKGKIDEYTYHQFAFFHLHGIEKSDRMTRIAMTDMLLHGDGHSNIRNTDALLSFDNYPDIIALGGEENEDPEVFDIILTNPPFGSLLQQETIKFLGRFELGRGKKSLPLEVLGLERCFQFLKPGGKLGIVLPDGILANRGFQFVRDWYWSQGEVVAQISLPQHTFVPYGAGTKTSMVFFRKFKKGKKMESYKTYMCKIDNIGYEATGRPIPRSEVEEVIRDFHQKRGWK